jgi:hypothetical protein
MTCTIRAVLAAGCLGLILSRSAAVEPAVVQQAIDRGVAALRKMQQPDGTWPHRWIGSTALAGLTLLECGVPANDPAVQRAAEAVRKECVTLTHTYSLALCIMFLDRLDDVRDVPLIQALGVRLLAGQNAVGGWSYECPQPDDEEVRRLTSLIQQRSQLVGSREPPRLTLVQRRDPRNLPVEIQKQLQIINRQAPAKGGGGRGGELGRDDNSNTQFAILGLWVIRRYGIVADNALARLDARYRHSQNPDGGWGYHYSSGGGQSQSTGAMTCAGLLGLAVQHGAVNESRLRTDPKGADKPPLPRSVPSDPAKDAAVRRGLLALGTTIGQPVGNKGGKGKGGPPIVARGPAIRKGYYYLWSVERVAVAYGLATIGNKDWYSWGAELLLASQDRDGSWHGEYGADVDTSFALLFLRRVNLTRDLTASLKGLVQDPGDVVLKAGGVGGEALLARGLASGIDYRDKPPADPVPREAPPPPPSSADTAIEVARLTRQLVQAPAAQQDQLLNQLRDGKGVVHTQALAAAIRQLDESSRKKAREALAERLTRMNAATLRDKLKDEDVEIRRAAALACALKEERAHVPDLIPLLVDRDLLVVRAARAALKSLTDQDFGPGPDAEPAERARAAAAWRAWWERQKGK